MVFAIIKKENNLKELIGFAQTLEDFHKLLKSETEYNKFEEGVSIEDLEINSCFKDDTYLLINKSIIQLVKKSNHLEKGWIYNTKSTRCNVLCEWKIIESLFNPFTDDRESCDTESYDTESYDTISYDTDFEDTYFKKHNISDLFARTSYPKILMVGKRGVGKTTKIVDILNKVPKEVIKNTLIISPSEKNSPNLKTIFPEAKTIYKWNSKKVAEYINNNEAGAIILDCCFNFNNWVNDPIYRELIFNGKSKKKMIITVLQFFVPIPPSIRYNYDYVYLHEESSKLLQLKMYKQFADMFPNFDCFLKVFKELTSEDYGRMIIKNICTSNKKIQDQVFWG